MTKVPYSDKLDADQQISTEERIASRISDLTEGTMEDEICAEIGRDALYIVLQEFRPDLLLGGNKP